MYNADFSHNKQLETQRDVFVFQCFVGCRVSDLYKMTNNNIIDGAIEYIPRKTKEDRPITVRVPLSKTACEIIEKYCDAERGVLFPFISEQKYNVAIKRIFKVAGLKRMVTVVTPTNYRALLWYKFCHCNKESSKSVVNKLQ